MKYLHHIIIPRTSAMLTSSDSVEIATLILCFIEIFTIAPFTIAIMAPVGPFESQCTPKYPSNHKKIFLSESAVRYRLIYSVTLRYIRPCLNLPQSSTLGSLTLVVSKDTSASTSGIALLHRNKIWVVVRWNCLAIYSGRSSLSSLSRILSILSPAGQALVQLRTYGNLSIICCRYLIMDMMSVPGKVPNYSSIPR